LRAEEAGWDVGANAWLAAVSNSEQLQNFAAVSITKLLQNSYKPHNDTFAVYHLSQADLVAFDRPVPHITSLGLITQQDSIV
jgi:hypothetical protein